MCVTNMGSLFCDVPSTGSATTSTPETLWRRELFPMGLRLLVGVIADLARGICVAIPQDETAATWEPSWSRPPIRRPDLILLGDGSDSADGLQVIRERSAYPPK